MKIYYELKICYIINVKSIPELNINREVLGWLIVSRTGHSHIADYHKRFGYIEANVQCIYGQKWLQFHLFSYLHTRSRKEKLFSLWNKTLFALNEILTTAKRVKIFVEWAPKIVIFWRNRGYGKQKGL